MRRRSPMRSSLSVKLRFTTLKASRSHRPRPQQATAVAAATERRADAEGFYGLPGDQLLMIFSTRLSVELVGQSDAVVVIRSSPNIGANRGCRFFKYSPIAAK